MLCTTAGSPAFLGRNPPAGQAGRSRINVNYEYQKRCEGTPLTVEGKGCHNRGEDWVGLGTTTQSPEATGTLLPEVAQRWGLPASTPVFGGGGDAVIQTTSMGIIDDSAIERAADPTHSDFERANDEEST